MYRTKPQQQMDKILKAHKKPKYNNVVTEDGDSAKERTRKFHLQILEKHGVISDLRCQVHFELIPAQYEEYTVDGKRKTLLKRRCIEQACKYIADFTYFKDGVYIVEDSKGVRTEGYIIKRKLMLKLFGIRILET